jgi:hypothetical protein
MREKDDPVRRRRFLLTAGSVVAAGAAGVWPTTANALPGDPDPAALLAQQLGNVLLGPTSTADVVAVDRLHRALATAGWNFAACQYVPLARRFPALLAAAEATAAHWSDPAAHQVLADVYKGFLPVDFGGGGPAPLVFDPRAQHSRVDAQFAGDLAIVGSVSITRCAAPTLYSAV